MSPMFSKAFISNMADPALVGLVVIVVLGLVFDFVNGFHDTANAIATSVATRVLSPGQAVSMAAVFNVIGAVSGTAVASTVGQGIVSPEVATLTLVAAALISAITWNLVTWWWALPSSSSHALIFSIVGAGIASAGIDAIEIGGITKTLQGLVFSPLFGFLAALLLLTALLWLFARSRPLRVNRIFGKLQIVSAAYMAFSHGSNDAQKTMGVITMGLASYYGWSGDEWQVPVWVILAAGAAMGLGTAMGGWRIVRTMGLKVVELRPIDGFAAETAAATVIEGASHFGIPVSTTHVISSAILGVGATRRASAVRWGIAGRIVMTWVVTIPACVALSWALYSLLHRITGLP
jgi:PiT family inorganic phosphate transporter